MGRDSGDSKPTSVKRKVSKRRFVESDEEVSEAISDLPPEVPRVKRARTAELDQVPTGNDPNGADNDMDVDIDGELDAAAIDEESRFLGPDTTGNLDAAPPSVAPGQARKKGKGESSGKRLKRVDSEVKKKKQVVYSDVEDADVDVDIAADDDDVFDESALSFADAQDDDFEPQHALKRGGKAKASSSIKSKATKVKPVLTKGGKGKAGKEKEKEKEIMIKDERKLPPGSPPSTSQTQPSNLFADDESSATLPAAEHSVTVDQSNLQSTELTKKRKLPTIKKNKPAASASTSAPSQSTTVPSKPPPPSNDVTKIIAPANQQRKPAALVGATDFDLRDKSVYAELFKGAGGSTPRSGLNRREKEERRKELNKMRDEAKAKRTEESKHFFNLQSQADKIARFEQYLRARNGMALHPNFLAAKFREEYDKDRMRLRQNREGSEITAKEEGEA